MGSVQVAPAAAALAAASALDGAAEAPAEEAAAPEKKKRGRPPKSKVAPSPLIRAGWSKFTYLEAGRFCALSTCT